MVWETVQVQDHIHIMPVDDIVGHYEMDSCACTPSFEKVKDKYIIIHYSYDSRELLEV